MSAEFGVNRGQIIDAEVKSKLVARDAQAWENLYEQISPLASYHARKKSLSTEEEKQEVTQLTALKAWDNIEGFDTTNPTTGRAWLSTIAHNTAADLSRSKGRIPPMVTSIKDKHGNIIDILETIPDPTTFEEILGNTLLSERLKAALRKIPEHYRKSVFFVHYIGCSYEEAAQLLGTKAGTIKSRVNRGLGMLRIILNDVKFE